MGTGSRRACKREGAPGSHCGAWGGARANASVPLGPDCTPVSVPESEDPGHEVITCPRPSSIPEDEDKLQGMDLSAGRSVAVPTPSWQLPSTAPCPSPGLLGLPIHGLKSPLL